MMDSYEAWKVKSEFLFLKSPLFQVQESNY